MRFLSTALLLVGTTRGWSQSPASELRAHDGFWAALAEGYGWGHATCDQCLGGSQRPGRVVTIKLGGTPSANVRLGVDLGGWIRTTDGDQEVLENVTFATYYFPSRASGAFLMGGLGASGYFLNTSPQTQGTGWGLTAGLGDELRLGRHFALTPMAAVGYGSVGDVTFGSPGPTIATGWSQTFVGVAIGVMYLTSTAPGGCQRDGSPRANRER